MQFVEFKSKPGVVSNNISNPRGMIHSINLNTGNAIASVMNKTLSHAITPHPALNAPKQNQPAKGYEVVDLTDE
ncbi:hypothetical protein TNCT_92911 [Trichonephila clavata]|uniref:Uncharacterized protein n=1 Tax=Trichonephila clavata TaxID=2740835 RepID=A0A8X6LFG2_TRICU|nr:hypothetical protein TNCT_92911 [Trichonephila clavata]